MGGGVRGGVGWDNNITGSLTHTSYYATVRSLGLPCVLHATLLGVLLDFHTSVMLRYCAFSWASTRASCYAMFSWASTHAFLRFLMKWALRSYLHDDQEDERMMMMMVMMMMMMMMM